MLVTCNFFFSQSVFERLELHTHKNQGLFGKGLKQHPSFNSLLKDKILELSKFKTLSMTIKNEAKMAKFVFDEAEKNVVIGEHAGVQYILHFPQ